MFLISLLFLLLSPASIFAKNVPRLDNAKNHDQRIVNLSYTGFGSATITFKDPRENEIFDYAIVTKYTTYHPNILTNALVANGYKTTMLESGRLCGWTKVKSVYRTLGMDFRNHRGDIYWKYSDSIHIPSSMSQAPSEDIINDITNILIRNPPAGDVYLLCTIILAWTTSLLSYMLFMILLMACIKKFDRNTNRSKDTEVDEGIELDSMEIPNYDSLPETVIGATPFEDVKYTYTGPQSGRTPSTGSMRSDLLPTYSREETRHGSTFDNIRIG
ncbi:unnamed protein product [Alternaria alternata]